MEPIKLSIVMFEEKLGSGRVWVAQCLEFDIAAQADTLADLPYQFQRAFVGLMAACAHAKVNPIEHLRSLGQAPEHYFGLFARGLRLATADVPRLRTPELLPTGLMLAERELRIAA